LNYFFHRQKKKKNIFKSQNFKFARTFFLFFFSRTERDLFPRTDLMMQTQPDDIVGNQVPSLNRTLSSKRNSKDLEKPKKDKKSKKRHKGSEEKNRDAASASDLFDSSAASFEEPLPQQLSATATETAVKQEPSAVKKEPSADSAPPDSGNLKFETAPPLPIEPNDDKTSLPGGLKAEDLDLQLSEPQLDATRLSAKCRVWRKGHSKSPTFEFKGAARAKFVNTGKVTFNLCEPIETHLRAVVGALDSAVLPMVATFRNKMQGPQTEEVPSATQPGVNAIWAPALKNQTVKEGRLKNDGVSKWPSSIQINVPWAMTQNSTEPFKNFKDTADSKSLSFEEAKGLEAQAFKLSLSDVRFYYTKADHQPCMAYSFFAEEVAFGPIGTAEGSSSNSSASGDPSTYTERQFSSMTPYNWKLDIDAGLAAADTSLCKTTIRFNGQQLLAVNVDAEATNMDAWVRYAEEDMYGSRKLKMGFASFPQAVRLEECVYDQLAARSLELASLFSNSKVEKKRFGKGRERSGRGHPRQVCVSAQVQPEGAERVRNRGRQRKDAGQVQHVLPVARHPDERRGENCHQSSRSRWQFDRRP